MEKQRLLQLASKILFAGATNDDEEIEEISAQLAEVIRKPNRNEGKNGFDTSPPNKDLTGFLKFTTQEISKMPKAFRHTFIAEGQIICYRKRKRGKISCSYEARYRRHGYNVSVSATNLIDLKRRFIEALHAAEAGEAAAKTPTTFHEFCMYYFETFRKRKVTADTFRRDLSRYKNHLQPFFGSRPLRQITPAQCQTLIDKVLDAGQEKSAQEIYSLLNSIFKNAIAHGIIERNPLAIVLQVEHEREHGKALTKDEERHLLSASAGTPYQLMFAVALYTGLRPNEYATARIEGSFIIAVNSKRKTRKVEYKKIPITPMLRPYLEGVTELRFYNPQHIREKIKSYLPEHKLYDLRTTFYTRCQECGVAEVARKEFVGHSLGKLGNAYTDLSDDFLLSEGKKLDY